MTGTVLTEDGYPIRFGAEEFIFTPSESISIDYLLRRTGGSIIDELVDPLEQGPSSYLVKVDVSDIDEIISHSLEVHGD